MSCLFNSRHKPESYFLPTAGGGYLWASPASRWSAACPDSPGTSPPPPCIPDTPEFDVSSLRPCFCLVRGPWRPSPQPPTEGLSGAQLTWGATRGRGWRGDAWRERRGETRRPLGNRVDLGRLLSEDWCDGTREAGHSCVYEEKSRGGYLKVFNGQFTQDHWLHDNKQVKRIVPLEVI